MNPKDIVELVTYDPESGLFTRDGRLIGGVTAQGYLTASLKQKPFLLHRLAFICMTGELPKGQVDHINGVRTDNRWCNLRDVTRQQNMFNKRPSLNRDLDMKNVYWIPKLEKYRVKMKIDGKTKHFGYFVSREEAIEKAKQVQLKEHGAYARSL